MPGRRIAAESRGDARALDAGTGGEGLGSLPTVQDADGDDDDLDVASAQSFSRNGSAPWLEQVAPGVWVKHVMVADLGGSIQLSNLPGVGWVLTNHTNTTSGPPGTTESGVYLLTPGESNGG